MDLWKDSLRNLQISGPKSYSKSIIGPEFLTAGLVGKDSGRQVVALEDEGLFASSVLEVWTRK